MGSQVGRVRYVGSGGGPLFIRSFSMLPGSFRLLIVIWELYAWFWITADGMGWLEDAVESGAFEWSH